MTNFARHTVFGLVLLLSAVSVGRGAIRVVAQVSTSRDIYAGERFVYSVVIDGHDKAAWVDTRPLERYAPQLVESRNVSQTSIQIVNGRTTQNTTKRYVMGYSLQVESPSKINIPSLDVVVEGKTYRTNPITVNIQKPGMTKLIALNVTLSQEKCYVGQPILFTADFSYAAQIADTQFNLPALDGGKFGFENPDVIVSQAREYDLGNGTTVMISKDRTTRDGQQFERLRMQKILIPKAAGMLKFDPATVSANVAIGQTRSRDGFFGDFFGSRTQYKRFVTGSEPITLNVLPLPQQGRPAGFTNLIGHYTISASASPTEVSVGDPITLTIKIAGGRLLKHIQWPDLDKIAAMAANFKIPTDKASPVIENGVKVFTQTIRAENADVTEIPPIPLAYFDARKGEYAVARSKPVKLDVSPTRKLTIADFEGRDFAPINKKVEVVKKGLSANYEGPDVLVNMSFSPLSAAASPGYALLWSLSFAAMVISALTKLATRTSPEKIARRRRKNAASKAIKQLKKIRPADDAAGSELMVAAMRQYIGDRFDRMAGSLTADECRGIIVDAAGDIEIADRFRQTMTACEQSRYASAQADASPQQVKEVIRLIAAIEKAAK